MAILAVKDTGVHSRRGYTESLDTSWMLLSPEVDSSVQLFPPYIFSSPVDCKLLNRPLSLPRAIVIMNLFVMFEG